MNVVLWILQVLLALVFVASGVMKSFLPKERFRERLPYVDDFSQAQMRGIGVLELLGGIGIVLPWATGIAPVLTPLAAAGLAITMILAAAVHRRRKEPFAVNLVLVAMAVIVAVGRF